MRVTLTGAVVLATVALVACSSSGGSTAAKSSPSTGGSNSTSPSTSAGVAAAEATIKPYLTLRSTIGLSVPLTSAPPKGKTVYVVALADPNNAPILAGLKAACTALGWTLKTLTNNGSNPTEANSQLEEAVQAHPDFIMAVGFATAELTSGIAQAKSAKIPFFQYADTALPQGPQNWIFADVDGGNSFALKGKINADYVIAQTKGAANVALVNVPAFPVLADFATGFENEFKANCASCGFGSVNLQYSDVAGGKLPSVVVAYLRTHPKVNNVVVSAGSFNVGLESAMTQAGLKVGAGGIEITEQSASDNNLTAIAAGQEEAALSAPLPFGGWVMADAMARESLGMSLAPNNNLSLPYLIQTKATVSGPQSRYLGPTGYASQFEQLWHLS